MNENDGVVETEGYDDGEECHAVRSLGCYATLQPLGAMRHLSTVLLLLAASTYVHADEMMWAGVKCSQTTDRLIVYYYAPIAIDAHGAMPKKGPNEWAASDLLSVADGQYEIQGATRVCELSHGRYTVSIEPDPVNLNPNGECGASVSLVVDIRRGNESILTRHRLDSEPCKAESITTTRIVVDAKSLRPKLTVRATHAPYTRAPDK